MEMKLQWQSSKPTLPRITVHVTSGVDFAVHSGQTFQETEHWVSETSLLPDF